MDEQMSTKTKLTEETVYRWGMPFGKTVEIVKVAVDHGDFGYNCWGYKLGSEMTVPGPLHFDSTWTTPGDALNAAHEEKNNLNRKN
jgi:hypothetical protein